MPRRKTAEQIAEGLTPDQVSEANRLPGDGDGNGAKAKPKLGRRAQLGMDGATLGPARGIKGSKEGAGPDVRDIYEYLQQAVPFKWVELVISGLTPLITHRASPRVIWDIETKQKGGPRQKKPPRNPPLACLDAAHLCTGRYDLGWLERNLCGFPAVGIKKAMAAGGYRFGDAPNIVESLGAITVHGQFDGLIPIFDLDGKPAPYVQRRDPVTLKAAGTMSLAYRPGFMPWMMTFQVQYCPSFLGLGKILDYLYLAGLTIGIGSWRKEKGGEMGKFQLVSFKHLPDDYEPPFEKAVIDEFVPPVVASAGAAAKAKAAKASAAAKAKAKEAEAEEEEVAAQGDD